MKVHCTVLFTDVILESRAHEERCSGHFPNLRSNVLLHDPITLSTIPGSVGTPGYLCAPSPPKFRLGTMEDR